MKNLYDILEVSKEASKEVIDKTYKTLAKKYHPDLNEGVSKLKSEEMMKKINYAYSVLGDEQKRAEYDAELEEQDKLKEESVEVKYSNFVNENNVKYKWTLKEVKSLFVTILVITIIFTILWIIPQTKALMISIYNSNIIIKIFVNILIGIYRSIISFFKNIFKIHL